MRRTLVLIGATLVTSLAFAGSFKYHDVDATYVSGDAKSGQFTIKFDDGSTSTGPAEGDAAKALAGLKAGDKVTVTCKDDAAGKHLAATSIKKH
jgi:hypothetical protein